MDDNTWYVLLTIAMNKMAHNCINNRVQLQSFEPKNLISIIFFSQYSTYIVRPESTSFCQKILTIFILNI